MEFFKEDLYELTEYTGYDLHGLYKNGNLITEKGNLFYIEFDNGDDGFEIYDYEKNEILCNHNSIRFPSIEDKFGSNFFSGYYEIGPEMEVQLYFESFEFMPLSEKFFCYEKSYEKLQETIFYKKMEFLKQYEHSLIDSEKNLRTYSELLQIMSEKCKLMDSYKRVVELESQNNFLDEVDFILDYSSENPIIKNMTSGFFEHVAENRKSILPEHEKLLEFLEQNPEVSNNVVMKETQINKNVFYKYHTYALKKYKKESE